MFKDGDLFCVYDVRESGKKSMLQGHESSVDESLFRAGLITPHRTSSPLKNTQSSFVFPDTSSPSSCQMLKGEFHSDRRCVDDLYCSFMWAVQDITFCLFSKLKYMSKI